MTERVADSFESLPMPGVLTDAPPVPVSADLHDGVTRDELLSQIAALEKHIETVTDYARQLWQQLSDVADYLREDIARGVTGAGVLASDESWTSWQAAYASTLSRLAGPRGDNGYGAYQASMEREHRFGPH
jgi:hypothetical protein